MKRSVLLAGAVTACAALVSLAPTASFAVAGSTAQPAAATPSYASASVSPDWVKTPQGLVNKTCVTVMPTGSSLNATASILTLASGARQSVSACRYPRITAPDRSPRAHSTAAVQAPATSGWLYASWWQSPTWLRRIYGKYAVPSNPGTNGGLNYFFSSLEPSNGSAIVQPVLQWGSNGSFGGNYWTIASWYVLGDGRSFVSSPQTVSPGDTIYGQVEGNSCGSTGSGCHWTIVTTDTTKGSAGTRLDITSDVAYTTAQGGVFESYGASGCVMLPASGHAAFRSISVYGPSFNQLTPAFSAIAFDQECSMSERVTATSADILWTP